MSDQVRDRTSRAEDLDGAEAQSGAPPLYSHIRELTPRDDEGFAEKSRAKERKASGGSGFFAQAARISMGTAFPALRSVARFLSLESYRTLPKHDRLPDLEDDVIEADLDDLLEQPEERAPLERDQLLDWDELEVGELAPTPYQLYLFDIRIESYLRQTKAQLSSLLL